MEKFNEMLSGLYFDDERKILFKKDIDALADEAERMVNVISFDQKKAAEEAERGLLERTLMNTLMITWVKTFSDPSYTPDGRNEQAVSMIRDIAEMEAFKDLANFFFGGIEYDENDPSHYEVGMYFAERGKRMHKTLMQSFTGFLFSWIKEHAKGDRWHANINDAMSEKYGENWDVLAFI